MRIKHASNINARQMFCVRLSFLLAKLVKNHTQKQIALAIDIKQVTVSRVIHGQWEKLSLEHLMFLADALNLDYNLLMQRRAGKLSVTLTGIESAVDVILRADTTKPGIHISRIY